MLCICVWADPFIVTGIDPFSFLICSGAHLRPMHCCRCPWEKDITSSWGIHLSLDQLYSVHGSLADTIISQSGSLWETSTLTQSYEGICCLPYHANTHNASSVSWQRQTQGQIQSAKLLRSIEFSPVKASLKVSFMHIFNLKHRLQLPSLAVIEYLWALTLHWCTCDYLF